MPPRLRIVGHIRSRHRDPTSVPGAGGPAEAGDLPEPICDPVPLGVRPLRNCK